MHCCNTKEAFEFIDTEKIDTFHVVAKDLSYSSGTGNLNVEMLDTNRQAHDICVTNVAYLPDTPMNLLSVGQLKQSGWTVDVMNLTLSHSSDVNVIFDITAEGNMFKLNGKYAEDATSTLSAVTPAVTPAQRDTSDWQLCQSVFNELIAMFDTDTEICELFRNQNNALLAQGYDVGEDSFTIEWVHKLFYGNPVFTHAFLKKVLLKAVEDFAKSPHDTRFLLIVPIWENAEFWSIVKRHFKVWKIFKKGSKLFTMTGNGAYNTENLEPAGDEGGAGRYFVGPTRWDVAAIYLDSSIDITIDDDVLCHLRLGHCGSKVQKAIREGGYETGLKLSDSNQPLPFCSACALSNACKKHAKATDHVIAENFGDLIVSDMKGPFRTAHDGSVYIIGFIDVCSGMSFTYATQYKSDLLDVFVTFMAEIQSKLKVKPKNMTFRVDNDPTYKGDFKALLISEGMGYQTTAPYVHTGNAVIERYWRTLLKVTRAIMTAVKFPFELWPLATNHAAHILNVIPDTKTSVTSDRALKSPYERAYGKLPDLSRMRVFGCTAYAWQDSSKLYTLANRSIEGLYVGYEEESPCYLLWDTQKQKIRRVGQVQFDESPKTLSSALSDRDALKSDFEVPLEEELYVSEADVSTQKSVDSVVNVLDICKMTDSNSECFAVALVAAQKDHSDSQWVTVRALFSHGSSAHVKNIAAFDVFMQNFANANKSLKMFAPLFAKCKVKRSNSKSLKTIEDATSAYILSHDPADNRFPYGVGYTEVAQLSKGSRTVQDVSRQRIIYDQGNLLAVVNNIVTKLPPEPTTHAEALRSLEAPQWIDAVDSEVQQLIDTGTLELCDEIEGAIPTRFVFKRKMKTVNEQAVLDKYKARLTVQGFHERFGVDYDETWAPVFQLVSLRIVFILAVQYGLQMYHADVKGAFLNATLKERLHIKFPRGFKIHGKSYARLKKSLYGLKQAAHDWFELQLSFVMNTTFLDGTRFVQSTVDPCMFFIRTEELFVILIVHVDDYVVATNNREWYDDFITKFNAVFEIVDLGEVDNVMQIHVEKTETGYALDQTRQINGLAASYNLLDNLRPVQTPMELGLVLEPEQSDESYDYPFRSLLGELLWIARCTRPDIMFAVIYLSRFTSAYGPAHYKALLRVLRYLITTKDEKYIIVIGN